MARKKKEDFDVVTASQTDDGTVVITSLNELSEERMNNVIRNAVASYDPENKQYSTYLKISASSETLTVDRIDELARGLPLNGVTITTQLTVHLKAQQVLLLAVPVLFPPLPQLMQHSI